MGDTQGVADQYLATHPCTRQELGLDESGDDEPSFFGIHENSFNDTNYYWKKLNCLDDPIGIQGDYNSYKARVLKIVFEKCNNDTITEGVCKSDIEIQQFMRRKFITTLHNQIRFNTAEYTDRRLVEESILSWYPIHSQIRQELANQVRVTDLQLQDVVHIQLGPITEVESSIFSLAPNTVRPYEYFDDVHIAVVFEFDLNLYRVDREAYNMLDWLGDIGGLKEALTIILSFIFVVFNYHTFEDYLVSHLYKSETSRDRAARRMKNGSEQRSLNLQKYPGNDLEPDKVNCLYQRFHDACSCCCSRRSKHYKLFEKGREDLENEIDIVEFLKNFRMLRKHVDLKAKLHFDEKKYVENNRFHKLTISDPSSSDNEPKAASRNISSQKMNQSSNEINHLDMTS